jgi:hypothetical protein
VIRLADPYDGYIALENTEERKGGHGKFGKRDRADFFRKVTIWYGNSLIN